MKKQPWITGKPTRRGWYLFDLGYVFLSSDLGYQHHVVSGRFTGAEYHNSLDNGLMDASQIQQHMAIPEPPFIPLQEQRQ